MRSAATKDRLPAGKTRAPAPSTNGCIGHAGATAARGVGLPPIATTAPPPKEAPPAAEERDERGRFTAGNRGGPGNPFARAVGTRRRALLDAVSPEDVAAVARKLLQRARAGDVASCKVLLAYVVGKPVPAPDPDALDLHELALARQAPLAEDVQALGRVAPALAAWLLGEFQAATPEEYDRLIEQRMRKLQSRVRELEDICEFGFALGDDEDEEDAVEASPPAAHGDAGG